jgi:hypothetical protein
MRRRDWYGQGVYKKVFIIAVFFAYSSIISAFAGILSLCSAQPSSGKSFNLKKIYAGEL